MSRILVADDDPKLRKLLALQLRQAGFEVLVAGDGAEALEMARETRPDGILSDVLMPRLDGFKLCRALREDPELASAAVVLISSGEIQAADLELSRTAGASDYVVRTPDGRAAIAALQAALASAASARAPGVDAECLYGLQEHFLDDGRKESRELLERLAEFDADEALRLAHRWAGVGGTLGFPAISQLAYQIEMELRQPAPEAAARIQAALEEMARLFSSAARPRDAAVAPAPDVQAELAGRRVALVGFEPAEGPRLLRAFEQAGAVGVSFGVEEVAPGCSMLERFELVVLDFSPEAARSAWGRAKDLADNDKPLLLTGSRETLLAHTSAVRDCAADFLLTPWYPEEAVLRAAGVLRRAREMAEPPPPAPPQGVEVVVADDDLTIAALVTATLKNHGVRCHIARNGREALAMAQQLRPAALVLDVNMPRLSGFDVLRELKSDAALAAIPVILLTARQQEADVLRGFGLGADDYMTKPFSPMELLARLNRLLRPAAHVVGA